MYRIGMQIDGTCLYVGQKIYILGTSHSHAQQSHHQAQAGQPHSHQQHQPFFVVESLSVNDQPVRAGFVDSKTVVTYISASAKVYLCIQLCKDMFEFAHDGETFVEKAIGGSVMNLDSGMLY